YRQLTLGEEGGEPPGLEPPLKRRKSEPDERSKHNSNSNDNKLLVRLSTGNTHITPTGTAIGVLQLGGESARLASERHGFGSQRGESKKRGRPRKHPLGDISLGPKVMCKVFTRTLYTVEQCAAERCQLPQEDTVEWVQCDDCDSWYHVACAGCNYTAVKEASAEFHCGCT
ncbi:transcription factor 19, partial [Callorhinchus milii]|uniref:transcription factor 19 n=1 Tax=Callorhinchus milii TaxID=7868 RepID=UPI001C3F5EA4